MGRTQYIIESPRHEVTRAMVSAATASDLTDATLAATRERIAALRAAHPDRAVRLLRLRLAGGASAGTLLSDLTREHALDVSLVQARGEDIQGVAVGKSGRAHG